MVLVCLYNCVKRVTGPIVYGGACLLALPSALMLVLISCDVVDTSYLPFVGAIGVAGAVVTTYMCACPDCEGSHASKTGLAHAVEGSTRA